MLQKDCIVVPSVANLYAQVVHSDLVQRWNKIQPIQCSSVRKGDDDDDKSEITAPDEVSPCHYHTVAPYRKTCT